MRTALSPAAAAALVPDGATVMIGGFVGVGTPNRTIRALMERGVRRLTVIASGTARPGIGIGLLIAAGRAAFDPAMSFSLIRGGHLDMTVLGVLQVDAKGQVRAATAAPLIVAAVRTMPE